MNIVQSWLNARAADLLHGPGAPRVDFGAPPGEPALAPADGVSWRVFSNPVSLFIGGATAVILELAEPRVRSGVWERTSFKSDPVGRMRRTGMMAMATVYAARSVALPLIARVNAMHARIEGATPQGVAYRAEDPELLRFVQATAAFGFLEAYCAYVSPLDLQSRDQYYAEGEAAAAAYGAIGAPRRTSEVEALFDAMRPHLEASPIVFEFLDILARAPALPQPLRAAQPMFIRAAVSLVPPDMRDLLGLQKRGLRIGERGVVRAAGRLAARTPLEGPAAQASQRMGYPSDYLYRQGGN